MPGRSGSPRPLVRLVLITLLLVTLTLPSGVHGLTAPVDGALSKPSDFTIVPPWSAGSTHTILNGYEGGKHRKTDSRNSSNDHYALDFDLSLDEAVYPVANGTVVYAGSAEKGWSSYGNIVFVDHGNGYQSLYAHLNSVDVSSGQAVTTATRLGGAGNTGTKDVHMHLVLYKDAQLQNSKKGVGPYGGNAVVPEPFASCVKNGSSGCEDLATGDQLHRTLPATDLVWQARENMPTARSDLGVVAASNGRIYAVGGIWPFGQTSVNEEYDPATNSWATRTSMPLGSRYGFGLAAASDGRLYAIGGFSGLVVGGQLGRVEAYDPATDSWTTRTSMPTARSSHGVAVASNGRIYAIGGCQVTPCQTVLNTVEEYDPATDTWATRASMPTARGYLAAVAASNGRIYAIGGATGPNGTNVVGTVEEYDPSTNTWTARASMPTLRANFALVAGSNGKLYAIGGSNSSGILATVEEYDPTTVTWSTRASLPTPRRSLGVAVVNGRIYAIGGADASNTKLATVEEAMVP